MVHADARSRSRAAAMVALPALAGALLLSGCDKNGTGGSAAAASTQTGAVAHGGYVALGDSYTAGPDIPDQTGDPVGCERSSENYPSDLAQALGLERSQFTDVSCTGATISDLMSAQSTKNGVNSAQLGALSADDAIVTIGIGGNDVDFAGVLTRCVEMDIAPSLIGSWAADSTPCEAYYTSGGTNELDEKIDTAAANLATALKQVRQRAPHARVYVVGYPALLPSSGTSCVHALGITSGDVAFLNQEEKRLNSMLRTQAHAAGDVYVDTYSPSQGHDTCSDADTRWIEPLIPASPAARLHPNARGEQGMADAVLAAIKSTS
ncbi:SGNH/GDSL hydrolase family protein [Actinospica sp. MGRD01-02]|uniref:SGNH/GDSL hydrolase family protein n=1 Tax=Actinospica acidithermotolerans TaxID=2828514 RepID=A0A941IJG5_9ACTN|nr:SGNH/GDSL hydrolase family protein [Actinospica acidithermotolerans]MBR7825701.1 SGNH/GDSL hydrolase family protein [Actinospica acidithermotolerans]